MRKLLLIGILALAGCQTINEPIARDGTVLFEIEMVNYAWVPTWKGYYIDSGGAIYSYDRSAEKPNSLGDKTEFTHGELMQKFEVKRTHVRELPMNDVLQKFDLIAAAAKGELTKVVGRCADAGTTTYRAYRFDFSKQKFVQVLLYQYGDRAQANLSAEGKELFGWLDSLQLVKRFGGCQP